MMKSRPTVLAAVIAVVVLALGISGLRTLALLSGLGAEITQYALPSPLLFPFTPRIYAPRLIAFVVQVVLLAAVVLLVSWLGSKAASIRGGFWAVLFSVWMATILAGYLVAPVAAPALYLGTSLEPEFITRQAMSLASNGGFFGLVYGWIAGIVAGIVHEVGAIRIMANGKPGTTSSPGS